MNPSVFPKFAQDKVDEVRKGFKHFYVLQGADRVVRGQAQYAGFCYIGTQAGNITRLGCMHEFGNVWESCRYAQTDLARLLKQTRAVFPEYIICESGMNASDIRGLRDFLNSNALLRCIPLLADLTGVQAEYIKGM